MLVQDCLLNGGTLTDMEGGTPTSGGMPIYDGPPWEKPRCFLIHAWSAPHWKNVIRAAEAALGNAFCVDWDGKFGNGYSIRLEALQSIREASLVIGVLDGLTPNITFETGFAMALEKPTILLLDEDARVDVCKFQGDGQCTLEQWTQNPRLDMNQHFSDLRDLVQDTYSWSDPDSIGGVLAGCLNRSRDSKPSPWNTVVETWIGQLAIAVNDAPAFASVWEILGERKIVDLTRPLFMTSRKKKLTDAIQAAYQEMSEDEAGE